MAKDNKHTTYLLDEFSKIPEINTPITDSFIRNLVEYCAMFETKNEHSAALNTYLLGTVPIFFTDTDRSVFFSIIGGVQEKKIKEILRYAPGIEPSWVVLNDSYNQMIVYTAHRIAISTISEELKEQGLLALFKMLHYKFFTSLVFHYYKFGANKDIMESVIKSLSAKYDIVKYGTWKKVIEVRSKDIFATDSIHFGTIYNFKYDADVIYVITDIQSRIRQKIRTINQIYREQKEKGDEIRSYGLVDEIDGQKVITSSTNILDMMLSSMTQQIQSPARFVDNELIHVLSQQYSAVNESTFRIIVTMFSELAAVQSTSGDFEKIRIVKNENEYGEEVQFEIYEGLGKLTYELLQKSYRRCMIDKVNMNSKIDILTKVKNIFSSSRISNEAIVTIKRSFTYFVSNCGETTRAATIASLTIVLILYIVIKSFDCLN